MRSRVNFRVRSGLCDYSFGMTDDAPLAPGLYVVGTPIGNLEDITLRALRVLKQADVIACEDTRHTRKLLEHYGITTATTSYHEHNEAERAAELVERLKTGARVALVSDAGMPGISDPGYRVVRAAIEAGIGIVPAPGPAAFVAALAASGLPTDEFSFRGFLPARSGERRTALETIRESQATEVFYEAPHRLVQAMEDVVSTLGGERPVVIARELTKIHEEFLRGSAGEVLAQLRGRDAIKGEIVLLIGKATKSARPVRDVGARLREIMSDGTDEKSALKRMAKETGLSRDELFRELQRRRR